MTKPDQIVLRAHAEPPMSTGFRFQAPIEITAAVEGAEGERRLPTFTMHAYTGRPMRVAAFFSPIVVDLAGVQSRANIPALRDHDMGRIVGHIGSVRVDAQGIYADGILSGTGPDAVEVRETAANGFRWQASIGASVVRREFLEPGKTAQVNGQTVSGPLIIARETVIHEISFTAIGADSNTSANVAASHTQEDGSMDFEQWLEANGFDVATISDRQKSALKAAWQAENSGGAVSPAATATAPGQAANAQSAAPATLSAVADPAATMRASAAAEAQRISDLALVCARYENPQIEVPGAEPNAPKRKVSLQAHAVAEGWDTNRTELEAMRASRPNVPAAGNSRSGQAPNAQVIEASLALSAGLSQAQVEASIPAADRERIMNEAMSASNRGYSIQSLMGAVVAAAGGHYAGSFRSNDFIRAAFSAERQLQASGFSTLSLSGILGNVANKAMIASYTAVETVWQHIAAIRSHGDFKVHTRYRLDSKGSFRKVGADGELKHVGLSEDSHTNQIDTFGAIVALTRQQIINDDMGAFLDLPRLLGRMGALRIEEALFVLWLSNPSGFFAAGNGNYIEGADTALDIDSLTAAETKFLNLVDSNGKPVLVTPDRLLVGTTLKTTADNLMAEKLIIDGAAGKKPARNPHAGKYRVFSSPYINNTAITDQDGAAISGQSGTAWWLLANPNNRAAVAVAFLNGQQQPVIESAETDFATLGMQWRAYSDFGVGMEERVAAVQSKGAA